MNDLINFFVKYSKWFVFLLYVVLSLILLFNNNPYQHHIYLTSAGSITSTIFKGANNVSSYFHLREINENLHQQYSNLQLENLTLRNRLQYYEEIYNIDTTNIPYILNQYKFIQAHVISNSTNRVHNYITINKGSNDGIKPEMGVIDQNGIVGIVNVTGKNSSRLISILNPDTKVSCELKGGKGIGSLVWDGKDPSIAVLQELPQHTNFNKGDTIITTGHSSAYPKGILVGYILSEKPNQDGSLKIKLAANFSKLSNVRVVINDLKQELDSLKDFDVKEK